MYCRIYERSRHLIITITLLLLWSCADKVIEEEVRPLYYYYHKGMSLLDSGDYEDAALEFSQVDKYYPYSVWSRRSLLMMGFSYYMARKCEEAISPLSLYIELYPLEEELVYAYYLRGLCFFDEITAANLDLEPVETSYQYLREIEDRFKGTAYASDVWLKKEVIINILAEKHMYVGRYYQKEGNYLASLNRYKEVEEKYSRTNQIREALYRQVESYLALGLDEEAKKASGILGYNYPESEWYIKSYKLLSRFGLVGEELKE